MAPARYAPLISSNSYVDIQAMSRKTFGLAQADENGLIR